MSSDVVEDNRGRIKTAHIDAAIYALRERLLERFAATATTPREIRWPNEVHYYGLLLSTTAGHIYSHKTGGDVIYYVCVFVSVCLYACYYSQGYATGLEEMS